MYLKDEIGDVLAYSAVVAGAVVVRPFSFLLSLIDYFSLPLSLPLCFFKKLQKEIRRRVKGWPFHPFVCSTQVRQEAAEAVQAVSGVRNHPEYVAKALATGPGTPSEQAMASDAALASRVENLEKDYVNISVRPVRHALDIIDAVYGISTMHWAFGSKE